MGVMLLIKALHEAGDGCKRGHGDLKQVLPTHLCIAACSYF